MGVLKNVGRLAMLGILACGGAWAQGSVSVQIGLNTPGVYFLIDGQQFSTTQTVQWAVGSTHQVYFILTPEADETFTNHQYPLFIQGSRFTFSNWNVVGGTGGNQPLLTITAGPGLSQIIGQVTWEVEVAVSFEGFTDPSLPCSPNPVSPDPREGAVVVNGTCYTSPGTFWMVPGPIDLEAAALPGNLFSGWMINGNPLFGQKISQYQIVIPTNIEAVFVKAKRLSIRSNPLGLDLLVDHRTVHPGPIPNTQYSGDPYCPVSSALLPLSASVGYVPLCVGDFDFLPGSQHILGAPPVQRDGVGKTWLFTGFSNGMQQNATYTAVVEVNGPDVFTANFSSSVPAQVLTSPAGLTVNVDGQDDSKGLQRFWAETQTHHLIAPPTQTDATGRPWQFVNWSNGGTADQNYTVPTGQLGVYMVANYAPLGKLQVLSIPSGLPFVVDGVACTTPCVLIDKPTGAKVQVIAPSSVTPNPVSRYTFDSWDGGNSTASLQVTIGDQGQVFTANYRSFFKITATAQPPKLVNFVYVPAPAADGFFPGGTLVFVTALPSNGYNFNRWGGDLFGTNATATLMMNAPHSIVAVLEGFPYINENGVKNSAGDTPSGTVGPGSLICIVGDALSSTTASAPAGELSQAIGDVWVTVNDRLLSLLSISPESINAQLFSDLPDGKYTLTVHRIGVADASRDFTVQRDSPGLFQWIPSENDPAVVAAYHDDGSMITPASPAAANETISITGTGFGLYDHGLVDGFLTPDTGDWNLVDPIQVKVDGQTYKPISAKAANGSAGVVALRVKLTGALPSGLVDLKATVNNVESNTVKLPIK